MLDLKDVKHRTRSINMTNPLYLTCKMKIITIKYIPLGPPDGAPGRKRLLRRGAPGQFQRSRQFSGAALGGREEPRSARPRVRLQQDSRWTGQAGRPPFSSPARAGGQEGGRAGGRSQTGGERRSAADPPGPLSRQLGPPALLRQRPLLPTVAACAAPSLPGAPNRGEGGSWSAAEPARCGSCEAASEGKSAQSARRRQPAPSARPGPASLIAAAAGSDGIWWRRLRLGACSTGPRSPQAEAALPPSFPPSARGAGAPRAPPSRPSGRLRHKGAAAERTEWRSGR